ncbi:MAG TPA: hypothetical protein VFM28_02930 [Nitrososphaeraceae archaeon]|nr:hypothetical protein [Nitrososphaeraceae archaeon]
MDHRICTKKILANEEISKRKKVYAKMKNIKNISNFDFSLSLILSSQVILVKFKGKDIDNIDFLIKR